ncbi:hypothetical protein C8J56DRAFT_362187 [Mycena floridula]|nr:hypothetical protein C8J56DRAFT_362187 [Mycena floridula]
MSSSPLTIIPSPVAIVTGSAQGIGRAIALRLADDGFDMAISDISAQHEKLLDLQKEILAKGRRCYVCVVDVSQEQQVRDMVEDTVKELGGIDVMVANAGINVMAPLIEQSVEGFDHCLAVNARGVFLCYKYAAIQMIKQGRGGRIIGASSVGGKQGIQLGTAYCAAKFAVRGITQTAALELGEHGITVNAYAPGAIETAMLSQAMASMGDPEVALKMTKQRVPLGKTGQPEDIAGLISYLVSKEGNFITGQTININGGWIFD